MIGLHHYLIISAMLFVLSIAGIVLMASASIYLMLLLQVRNATSAPFKVALWPLIGVVIIRSVVGFVGLGRVRAPVSSSSGT